MLNWKASLKEQNKNYPKGDQDNVPIVFLKLIRPDGKKNPRLLKTRLDLGQTRL